MTNEELLGSIYKEILDARMNVKYHESRAAWCLAYETQRRAGSAIAAAMALISLPFIALIPLASAWILGGVAIVNALIGGFSIYISMQGMAKAATEHTKLALQWKFLRRDLDVLQIEVETEVTDDWAGEKYSLKFADLMSRKGSIVEEDLQDEKMLLDSQLKVLTEEFGIKYAKTYMAPYYEDLEGGSQPRVSGTQPDERPRGEMTLPVNQEATVSQEAKR